MKQHVFTSKQCDLKQLDSNEYILHDSIYITCKDGQNSSVALSIRWVIIGWWLIIGMGPKGHGMLVTVSCLLIIRVQFLKTEQNLHFVYFCMHMFSLNRKLKKKKEKKMKWQKKHCAPKNWFPWIWVVVDFCRQDQGEPWCALARRSFLSHQLHPEVS